MSNYYGLHCADCDETTHDSFNHADKDLITYVQAWRLLKSNGFSLDYPVSLQFQYNNGNDLDLFMDKHFSHKVCVKSEYYTEAAIEVPEFVAP